MVQSITEAVADAPESAAFTDRYHEVARLLDGVLGDAVDDVHFAALVDEVVGDILEAIER